MTESSEPDPLKSSTTDALAVRVYQQPEHLAAAAARLAHEHLRQTLAVQPRATLILAAAASQEKFLDRLVALPGLDWSRLTLFHMDEYLGIPDGHPASFRRFLRERVEQRVKPRAFHCLAGDALEPIAECERYSRLLQAQPIDLCCLGIGENGHIAFNDPPVANFDDPRHVKIVKLDTACRRQQVGEGHFPSLETVPQYALTLTVPALCAARKMVCVVPDRRKARAVKDTLEGPVSPACPASFLRTQGHCTLFLDAHSAGLLA